MYAAGILLNDNTVITTVTTSMQFARLLFRLHTRGRI